MPVIASIDPSNNHSHRTDMNAPPQKPISKVIFPIAGFGPFSAGHQGQRSGSKRGFLQATVDLGEHHPEIGAEFAAWLAARQGGSA